MWFSLAKKNAGPLARFWLNGARFVTYKLIKQVVKAQRFKEKKKARGHGT